jgi:UDP-2,4-diacetamido-2,4,6-trideoxy-beta-L-altropyranose hydrolase
VSETLLIRADASARTGTGHMMRCIALAQAWRRSGGTAIFVSAETTAALEARLVAEKFQNVRIPVTPGTKEDGAKTGEIAKINNAFWIVADSYNFGLDYQRAIQAAGIRLLFIDDYGHAGEYAADLVLNQNLAADAALYGRRERHTRLLLGPRYALLREEFLRWHDWQRQIPEVVRKVLITLGGSDPDNVTARVVEALRGLDVEMRIVLGGSNPHFDLLSSAVCPPSSVIRDATNMPELMAWADVAITAGGSTCWELAFMALPSIVMVLADNQAASAQRLHEVGVVFSVGRAAECSADVLANALDNLINDAARRRTQSECGRLLVDGRGADRVTAAIRGELDQDEKTN